MAGEAIKDLSSRSIEGSLTVTGKIRGLQGTVEGDAVMLGANGKIPTDKYDQTTVDLSNYYTKSEVYTKTEVDSKLNGKLDSSALAGYATTAYVTSALAAYVPTARTVNGKALTGNITLTAADVGAAPEAPWSHEFTGNGTTKTFTYAHDRGTDAVSHDLWKYDTTNSRWELYITDLAVTSTQVTVDFYDAPTSSDKFKIVLR